MRDIRQKIKTGMTFVKNDHTMKVLLLILVAGAALRYYGLRNAENTDEYNEVMEALRVASGKLNYERWWKKGYQNILAVEYGIYFIIGYMQQIFSSPMDFAAKIIRDMEPLFLIGRYTTATLGTLSIALIYMIGSRIYNARVGLIAAGFFAVETINVWTSHLVNTDVPLTFFFLLSFYCISRFYFSGKIGDYVAAAFFGAVAVNIKIIGVGIGIIFVLSHIIRCNKEGKRVIDSIVSKEMLFSAIAFLLGFILSNPAIIVGAKKFITFHYAVYTNVYDEVPYAIDGNAYYTYFLLLYEDFGLPLCILTAASILYAVYKRVSWDYILLPFIIALFLLLANTTFLVQDRYLMIIFPAIFLLCGRLLDHVTNRISTKGIVQNTILVTLCILVSSHFVINSVRYVRTLTEENTSVISKKWIENHIPSGTKILMDAGRTIITSGPRLNQSREKLEEKLNIIKNLHDGQTYDSALVRIVDAYASIYFELLLKNMPEITYTITTTELGRNVESADYYITNGYEYFIHNADLTFRIEDPLWRKKFPQSASFYDSLDKNFTLVKTFGPSDRRSGSTIKIYRIP